jgi:hypothetical protein
MNPDQPERETCVKFAYVEVHYCEAVSFRITGRHFGIITWACHPISNSMGIKVHRNSSLSRVPGESSNSSDCMVAVQTPVETNGLGGLAPRMDVAR